MKEKLIGNNPVFALNCLLKALKMAINKPLRAYVIVPVLINLVLYSLAFYIAYVYLDDFISSLLPSWLNWLEWLIWPIFFVSIFMLIFFSFALLANLIAAPFYCQLAAKTLNFITDEEHEVKTLSNGNIFLTELIRLYYLLSRMLPFLILFIIPVVNVIAPILWLLFGSWTLGLEFFSYHFENRGLTFKAQKQKAKSKRLGVMSFGGMVMFVLTLPVFNLLIAPAAVIAATLYSHQVWPEIE